VTETWYDGQGNWVQPSVKLSDEGVYLATKFMPAVERGRKYPIDFDQNGHIRATRTPGSRDSRKNYWWASESVSARKTALRGLASPLAVIAAQQAES
jgi:hypothetical protein